MSVTQRISTLLDKANERAGAAFRLESWAEYNRYMGEVRAYNECLEILVQPETKEVQNEV